MSENLNLKKTIILPDPDNATQTKEFNINAVYSDEAGKVTTPLVIKESLATGEQKGRYNGDAADSAITEINYVPATGGAFNGPVHLDNKHGVSVGGVLDSEIINYGQMKTKISQLTGATLYNWTPEGTLTELEKNTNEYYKLNTVVGRTADLSSLEVYSEGKTDAEYKNIDEYRANPVSYSSQSSYYNAYFNLSNGATSANPIAEPVIINGVYSNKPVQIKDSGFEGRTYIQYNGAESKLTQIHLNPGVLAIGTKAFKDCRNLEAIVMPDSIITIGVSAFEGCSVLDAVNLSRGITKIQSATFKNCTGLTEITIGYQTTEIAADAFYGCTNLKHIYYTGTKAAWESISNNPFIDDETVTVHFGDLPFPFLYICDDGDTDTSLTSNKMFLKMPGEKLIEVSKGAARLERPSMNPNSDSNYKYYTYDTLAAIIAGINKRLEGLGSVTAKVPDTLPESDFVIIPEELRTEVLDDNFHPDEVPTVQELQSKITEITGITRTFNAEAEGDKVAYSDPNDYTGNIVSVLQAKADETGRNIQTGYYRKTINDFTKEAGVEQTNTITISNEIPTKDTPGEWKIGDIMIVINTEDNEVSE